MRKFVIVTDSCSDLSKENREKYDIEYIPMRIIYDDKDVPASLDWEYVSFKDFYDLMRNGTRIRTAQINTEEYTAVFEKYINDGFDILSISCSSALSSSYMGSTVVRDELKEKYPEAKIICIDSRNSCMGLGIICMTASKLRAEGKSIEETAEYIETHKQSVLQYAVADDLIYLKRAGRVSATSAVFGGILQIKPIVISDYMGRNVAFEKARGKKLAYNRMEQLFTENYLSDKYQRIAIIHADMEEEAKAFKERIENIMPEKDIEITIEKMGPIIGASIGPGTVAIYFVGKSMEIGKEDE